MVSINAAWLKSWFPKTAMDLDHVCQMLTQQGIETEKDETASLHGVVVGQILSVNPHPDANKLSVCTIAVGGSEPLSIVCGCSSVRVGARVAVAQLGTQLPALSIEKLTVRGVTSEGMLCSKSELGLLRTGGDKGIWHLSPDAAVGMPIMQHLKREATLLHMDITPNRGDCMSVQGLVRELAMALQLPQPDSINTVESVDTLATKQLKKLETPKILTEHCLEFNAVRIEGIHPGAYIPDWASQRLQDAGFSLHGSVVDVVNYVMLELGQPLHCYDASKVSGPWSVKEASSQETLLLLNDQSVQLDDSTVCVYAGGKPVAIAGYMGSKDSACDANTTAIVLESAYFKPDAIAYHCRRYKQHSHAGARFERGVDPKFVQKALMRAVEYITLWLGGKPVALAVHCQEGNVCAPIAMPKEQVVTALGMKISDDRCRMLWERSGVKVDDHGASWELTAPSWRHDLVIPEQYVSEIIRFNMIAVEHPWRMRFSHFTKPELKEFANERSMESKVRSFFRSIGCFETLTLSFAEDEKNASFLADNTQSLELLNPLNVTMAQLRCSLFPGLLEQLGNNINRGRKNVRLFEMGRVFSQVDGMAKEEKCLSAVLTGEMFSEGWLMSQKPLDFFTLKAFATQLCIRLGLTGGELTWRAETALQGVHPYQCGGYYSGGRELISLGTLHPELRREYSLRSDVFLLRCDLNALQKLSQVPCTYKPYSQYQKVRRDLSLSVPEEVSYQQIEQEVRSLNFDGCLKTMFIFDIYKENSQRQSVFSIGLALVFQSAVKTLSDEQLQGFLSEITERLQKSLGITIRGM